MSECKGVGESRCHIAECRETRVCQRPVTAPTPDAEAVARVKLLEATECGCDLCEAILDTYREAVERRVRAECAAKMDALEEFIALECDQTQFIGAKREWLIGLHRKHFPQNYAPEAHP